MSKSRLLTAITSRLSHNRHERQGHASYAADQESEQLHTELETYDCNQPFYSLAESIGVLETATEASRRQRTEIMRVITDDAHDLAARVLPPSISDALGVRAKHPDNIGFDCGSTPPLRALHLLLHAYDHTHDRTLKRAITYILQVSPPTITAIYREAYEYATETNRSIMSELRELAAYQDDILDETTQPIPPRPKLTSELQ